MTPSPTAPNDRTLSVVLPVDLAAAATTRQVTSSAAEATELRISADPTEELAYVCARCLEQIKSAYGTYIYCNNQPDRSSGTEHALALRPRARGFGLGKFNGRRHTLPAFPFEGAMAACGRRRLPMGLMCEHPLGSLPSTFFLLRLITHTVKNSFLFHEGTHGEISFCF